MRENFVRIKQNVWIIHASKSMEKHAIGQTAIVRIVREVWISNGQIIRAILYHHSLLQYFDLHFDMKKSYLVYWYSWHCITVV